MKIILPIVDYDDMTVEISPDNPGHLRLSLNDYTNVDLNPSEISDLANAMTIIVNKINSRLR